MGNNYLYISKTEDAYMNLAVDEWFIDHLQKDDLLLYFYVNKNAVIIGKNQNPWRECNLSAMEKDGVQLVRRISGGGAVYHDSGNLNFSFIAGETRYDKERQHRFVGEAVGSLGIPCTFSGRNDLLVEGRKISGNAYCQREKVKQHHGTLLIDANLDKLQKYLNVDPKKIRSKGVESVRMRVCNLKEFLPELTVAQMLGILSDAYGKEYGKFELFCPNKAVEAEFEKYRQKHCSAEWRLGSTPAFDYEISERFLFGGVQILFSLEKGAVKNVKVYTDANAADLSERLEKALIGLPFEVKALSERLLQNTEPIFQTLGEYISGLAL